MIEFPHLMMVVMALITLGSVLTNILMARGKAGVDRMNALEKAVSEKASVGRVGALEDRTDRNENRITTIEVDIRHLPSREQTHSMELSLQEMKGQLAVLTEKMIPVASTNQRLQDYLLKQGER